MAKPHRTKKTDIFRQCSDCNKILPNTLDHFHKLGDGLRARCKLCSVARTTDYNKANRSTISIREKAYKKENPDKVKQWERSWHLNNPERSNEIYRKGYLKRVYGLDPQKLEYMCVSQGYKCANPGCNQEIASSGMASHIDHNHTTGVIRGVLCQKCNQALGLLKEDPVRISGLVEYLEKTNVSV